MSVYLFPVKANSGLVVGVAFVAHVYAFQSPSVLVDMWGGWWWCCCLALGTESSALLIFVNHFLTNNTANSRKFRGRIVGVDGWMDGGG